MCVFLFLLFFIFLFFFYSSGDHRDLHSFPTRRSSDRAGAIVHCIIVTRCVEKTLQILWLSYNAVTLFCPGKKHPAKFKISCTLYSRRYWALDRKSTRLNSSHGYISYAVFCLKKKKKKNKKKKIKKKKQDTNYVISESRRMMR